MWDRPSVEIMLAMELPVKSGFRQVPFSLDVNRACLELIPSTFWCLRTASNSVENLEAGCIILARTGP
jgi:hypothetical protein